MTDTDRMVTGKFVSLMKKMSFDTGMKIGLMAGLYGIDLPKDTLEDDEE